ncbi:MAG: DNA-binding protein [Clostridia bacterium]|nr:DNA-binding protein [Clostridia bacterium]
MSIYLGVDTSNYTTSFAVSGDVSRMVRKILPVPEGQRGIRQSDGVFSHIKQAPTLYKELVDGLDIKNVKAIGVSTRPRSVEGSYMPVFLAGETFARVISATLSVPLYEFSHQDGHIMAGIMSANRLDLLNNEFFSVHLSGGTFEILKSGYNGYNFDTKIVGGTKDISAGQLIDRVGVAAGMKFPCGKEISKLAAAADGKLPLLSVSENNGYINFSGAETQAMRLVGEIPTENICRAVIECIGRSIIKALNSVGARAILMVGGVSASGYLREYLISNCDIDFIFASNEMSTDNAWGIAKLTEMREGE